MHFNFHFLNNKYKKITLLIIITIITILVSLAVGFFIGIIYKANDANKKSESHETGYKYISPLLECENNLPLNYNNVKLKGSIQTMIDTAIDSHNVSFVSLYFRDLNNGPWIGINEKEKFSPASLLKVPLMMAYLKLAETNPALLNQKLTVKDYQETVVSQNIAPSQKVEVGKEYTVEELIDDMIEYSDNTAANTLISNIPSNDLDRIYTDFNLKTPTAESKENFMTVTEYSSFFRILYNSSYLNRAMSEKALKLLTKSQFTQGLAGLLPKNIEISHKFGEREINGAKQLHDCGIIYLNEKNYLLCVMTRGDDFKKMENTIASLSQNIFTSVNSFTK